MYNIIMYAYQFGLMVYSHFNDKVRKMWKGERKAVSILKAQVDPQAKYVWFHAASLGEFEQGRPLMELLRHRHPEYKILHSHIRSYAVVFLPIAKKMGLKTIT